MATEGVPIVKSSHVITSMVEEPLPWPLVSDEQDKAGILAAQVSFTDRRMIKTTLLVVIVTSLVAVILTSCGGAYAAPATATLVYSGNLDGELEPCGCSEAGDLGGILRRASKLDELRKQQPALFLISSGSLLANASPRDRLKSEYILKGIAAMNYDAIGLQWRDLAYGVDFLNTTIPLPWTVTNWEKQRVFPPQRNIKHGDVELAFFSWLDPGSSPFQQMKGNHNPAINNADRLQTALQKANQKGLVTVLTTSLTLDQAEKLVALDNIDILVIKSAYEKYGKPVLEGKTLVLQPGSRGMRLGRVDLKIDKKGNITSWQHDVIPLPESIPDAPSLKAWYDEYNTKVKAAYLASSEQRKLQQSGQSPYTGSEACQSCHEKPGKIWSESLHARAFERLEEVGKSFDPDCIICHTVGFEQPGGYIDARLTTHLLNVQCESCHGAGKAHTDSLGGKPTPNAGWTKEKICDQCHTQPHSPDFDFDSYWAHIAH